MKASFLLAGLKPTASRVFCSRDLFSTAALQQLPYLPNTMSDPPPPVSETHLKASAIFVQLNISASNFYLWNKNTILEELFSIALPYG